MGLEGFENSGSESVACVVDIQINSTGLLKIVRSLVEDR